MNTISSKKISPQSYLSFNASILCGSPREDFLFSLLDDNSGSMSFTFTGSRIYDPFGRFIYSYSSGDTVLISGNFISGKVFNYSIGDFLFPDASIFDTARNITGVSALSDASNYSIQLNLFGTIPSYSLTCSDKIINNDATLTLSNHSSGFFTLYNLYPDTHYSKLSELVMSPKISGDFPIVISGQSSIEFDLNFAATMRDSSTVIPIVLESDFGTFYQDVSLTRDDYLSNFVYSQFLNSGIATSAGNSVDVKILFYAYLSYSNAALNLINLNSGSVTGSANGRGLSGFSYSGASGQYYSGISGVDYSSIYCDMSILLNRTGDYPISGGFSYSAQIGNGIKTGEVDVIMYDDLTFDIYAK